MEPEEKKDNQDKFGKVIEALHEDKKLSSLRTYQGDMAQFIKEKNESVISVAVKEKKRKEEREELEKKKVGEIKLSAEPAPQRAKSGFKGNFVFLMLSLVLLVAGTGIGLYIYSLYQTGPVVETEKEDQIVPYSNIASMANPTKESFDSEFSKLSSQSGALVVNITDAKGDMVWRAKDFLSLMDISLPPALYRILKDEYAVGKFAAQGKQASFMVISVADFGQAFAGMLEWEAVMEKDLHFLAKPAVTESQSAAQTGASTTAPSVAAKESAPVTILLATQSFSWKDLIIKNKDTRALVDPKNQSKIGYTFLDKNTILIVDDISLIGDMYAAYASRSVAR